MAESKQTRMSEDGDIEDGDDGDLELDDDREVTKESQIKVVAELTGISLKSGQRIFSLKVVAPQMIKSLTKIFQEQRAFLMAFKVPMEKSNGKVTSWKTVEFSTKLVSLMLKGKDSAVVHGYIDHAGACAMSELILNWKGGVEFMLDGVQQTLF